MYNSLHIYAEWTFSKNNIVEKQYCLILCDEKLTAYQVNAVFVGKTNLKRMSGILSWILTY